jgi:diguanylate cyclase (GGDEF)-like protein/PAS domain S-box-containing protein
MGYSPTCRLLAQPFGRAMTPRSIRSRLLLLVVATIAPFLALITLGLWKQWNYDHAGATARSRIEARLLAAQLDDQIGNFEYLLAGLSRAVSTNPADSKVNDALLRRSLADLPGFVNTLFVSSLDGTNIGSSSDTSRLNVSPRAFFREVLAGKRLVIGDIIRARTDGQWLVNIARAVEDDSGHLLAVITVGIRLARIQEALRVAGLPSGSVVKIVSDSGTVLAWMPGGAKWIGQNLGKDGVAPHLDGRESRGVIAWPDGVERITGLAIANLAPWTVFVGLPKSTAFAEVVWRLTIGSLFSAFAVLSAIAIAWLSSGRLVRPLQQLARDASVLADGELRHRTSVRTKDEVGALAHAFNRMAASLERRDGEAARAADEVRQSNDTLAAVIDASPVAIVCSSPDRLIVLWSRAAEQIFGYSSEEAVGQPTKILPPDGIGRSQILFERAMRGETLRDVELKRMRKDGSLVDVRVSCAPMYHRDGTIRGVAWSYQDITLRKQAEEQLKHLAHYDQLTGLPNRLTLQKELENLLQQEAAGPVAVAMFDLDGFKDVNDTLGHSTGDRLLVEVGRRLADSAGGIGQVCRLGGDEFVVFVPDCGDPTRIAQLVHTMLKRLQEPFEIHDNVLHLAGSAGIAIAPHDGATVDELIANADLALYQAKADGGRIYRFFLPVLRAQAQARRGLEHELRRAFAENEFEIYFQPQIDLSNRFVVGAEALLRWRHPVRGVLAPGAFIDALADSSIASDVGRWIIRTACQQAAVWRAAGFPLRRIGVNLFPCQSRDPALLPDIQQVLRETGLPAEFLELEITENFALTCEGETLPLQQLHEIGVKLAFDDFGTGYASLSYLTRLPISRIKIDRGFVLNLSANAEDAAIVRSLIAMAHNLGLEVIAEGVETEAQAAFLLKEKCEEAQGFLYSRALPAEQFTEYLLNGATDFRSDEDRAGRERVRKRRAGSVKALRSGIS